MRQAERHERDERDDFRDRRDAAHVRSQRGSADVDHGEAGNDRNEEHGARQRAAEARQQRADRVGEHGGDGAHRERDAEPEQDAAQISGVGAERRRNVRVWAAALWDAAAGLCDAEGDERRRQGAHEVGKGSRGTEAGCHVRGKHEDRRADGDIEDGSGEPAHADHTPQRRFGHTAAAINSENFSRSMLPPETMATTGPLPTLPVSAAARPSAPAPSAITRAFSAMRRMARFTSSRVTTMEPSTTGSMRCHIRGNTLLPPAPSTNVAFQSENTCAEPFANESAAGAAVSGSAPHTRISGRNAFTALATPVTRPPPPIAAMMATVSGASSRISRPIDPCPAMKLSSSNGWINVPVTPG